MREKSQRYVGRVDYHSEFHLAKAPQNKGSAAIALLLSLNLKIKNTALRNNSPEMQKAQSSDVEGLG